MKKLVIRSEDGKEDAQAALQITKAMQMGDADQIVWYSSMGQKTAQMHATNKAMNKLTHQIDVMIKRQNEADSKLSDLKFKIEALEDILKTTKVKA